MIDFSNVLNLLLGNTPVEQVSDSRGNVLWSSAPVLPNYFYVEDASGQANTLRILKGGTGSAPTVEVFCSTDRVNWTSMGSTSTTPITATVPANGKLYLKANTERFGGGWDGENNINCNASFNVGGNIMSMLNGDNFDGSTFAPNTTHNFGCIFKWSNVVDASNLVLPDTVTSYCYWGCFYGCTSLTTAPALPATIMAEECYNAMFNGCGSLTSVPALPATTLAQNCYFGMFSGCASLTTAPVLPATTLATGCYSNMFNGCTNLNTVTTYAQDISAERCLNNWLSNIAATGDFYNYSDVTYPSGESGIPNGWTEHTLPKYFYVEDTSGAANTLSIKKGDSSAPDVEVFCSTDKSNWTSMGTTSTTAITATVPANGKLYLKATANSFYYNNITSQFNFNVGGNIMSLLYGDNFEGQTTFPSSTTQNFQQIFQNSNKIINAQNLILPATTLTQNCYCSMFYNCTSLTTAPALPATTLAEGCYRSMFQYCTSLTTAPALPATTLAERCYQEMFYGCSSLTTAPATLPATTLAQNCYVVMFQDCTSLTSTPELPATTLAQGCYYGMFGGCTSLTQAPASLPATTMTQDCYANMFQGCTSLTTAPALPATTLATRCYANMFQGCTSLTTTPELPATAMADYCYRSMFQGCTSLNSVITYASRIFVNNCLDNWLANVSGTGDFYNMACTTYPSGDSGIPNGWTEHHTTASTIDVTITNTSNYSSATYQIDSGTEQPINVTGTTSFTVHATAASLTVNRNAKGVTEINGVCGITSDSEFTTVIPVGKMSDNVSIDLVNLM